MRHQQSELRTAHCSKARCRRQRKQAAFATAALLGESHAFHTHTHRLSIAPYHGKPWPVSTAKPSHRHSQLHMVSMMRPKFAQLWCKPRDDGDLKRKYQSTPHDEVTYQDRSGHHLCIPQAERYTSLDWYHNICTLPTSIILDRIKVPIFWQMAWAGVVCVAHALFQFTPLSLKPQTLLGSALGLLLVFRTNAAYNRFWEGRQIWEKVLNQARDISRMVMAYTDTIGQRGVIRMANLLAAYPIILQEHLQSKQCPERYQDLLPEPELQELRRTTCNRPLMLINKLTKMARAIPYGEDWSSRERLGLLTMINKLGESIGGCERLVQTPVPLHYVRHTSRFLTIWCFLVPLTMVGELGVACIPVTGLMTWALFGIQEIGLLIEDPFRRTLKLEVICDTIRSDVMQTVGIASPVNPRALEMDLVQHSIRDAVAAGASLTNEATRTNAEVPLAVVQ